MTKGLKEGKPNGRDVYPDIIDYPQWQSSTQPHMSLYNRVAQSSSFDALAGYSDMVKEEQQETDSQVELGEVELEKLNQKLGLIEDVIADDHHLELTFTVFKPDEHKTGGAYVEITDAVKKVDTVNRKVILVSTEGHRRKNKTIDFSAISDIFGKLVDYMDDL